MLSIIIPTLNAGHCLLKTLQIIAAAHSRLGCEIIVADGGSVDDTALMAFKGGAIFIDAPRGRGRQLATGAGSAAGDWFLFLHADTRLGPGWAEAVEVFMANPHNRGRAGFFRFVLDDPAIAARCLECVVAWRGRLLGLPYGDQGLLISRAFYEQLGGYKLIPLMEDVELVRRIGRRRLRALNTAAVTSAERYRRDGYLMRPLRNLFCLCLYSVGVPPKYIAAIYR